MSSYAVAPPPPTPGPKPDPRTQLASLIAPSMGVRDAQGNQFADRNASPRAYTAGAFNPGAGQWGEYGDPTKGPWSSEIRDGIQYVNGKPYNAQPNASGGIEFTNWEAHHKPIYNAQWEAFRASQGDPNKPVMMAGGSGTPIPSASGPMATGPVPDSSGLTRPMPTGTATGDATGSGLTRSAGVPAGAPAGAPATPGAAPPGTMGAAPASPSAPAWDAGLPSIDTDFSGQAQRGADAAYRGATQFFDEDFARDRDALESKLVNQGFARGTEGFDQALSTMMRSQNAARTGAAFTAQGVGHQQAGDLLLRALQARGALSGERLAARGQDLSRYGIDTNAELSRRGLGLNESNMDFQQLMQLLGMSRSGVNVPNFGAPSPLDVGSAYSIAGRNQDRNAIDRNALYQLGGAALGGVNWGDVYNWFAG